MTTPEAQLRDLFDAAGTTGWLHARDLTSGHEIGVGADDAVVLASVFKIPVLLELFSQAAEGRLDVAAPVTVPVESRAPGPFGLSVMRDPAQLSLRDLAWLMMGISDNAATDVICAAVGIDAVNTRMAGLGLADTVLIGDCRALFATVSEDIGAELDAIDLTDASLLDRMRALDPTATSRSTPRQMTELLARIWADDAAAPEVCAEVRRILSLQVWPHRMSSGFPEDDVKVSAKTGTLPRVRNECGVVEYGDGGRFAVAVFTRSVSTAMKNPAADAVIGTAARCAVDLLRGVPAS